MDQPQILKELAQILTRSGYTVLDEIPTTTRRCWSLPNRTRNLLKEIYSNRVDDRLTPKQFYSNIEEKRLNVLEFIRDFQRYPQVFENYSGFGKKSMQAVSDFIDEFKLQMVPDPSLFDWQFHGNKLTCYVEPVEFESFVFILAPGEDGVLLTWECFDEDYYKVFNSNETLAEIEFYIKENILCYA